ncbi:DUF4367 domain-containing protein [Shouchella rhizosphaerae]|uniref:DUF4367 domain-containing protein n=1 Tax=Shouchella rhizosphaerae TaxID=866786 RepID=UPI0020424F64|nr:DUF4367 domain-containing protein [Shouchella rhizosphaerae]MCM3379488.1 DUF4367 domain-containing protein [Shouchella rhizosphaerae]
MTLNKLLSGLLVVISLFTGGVEDPLTPDPNKPLGDVLPIEKAVQEFNYLYGIEVVLPQYLPIHYTTQGGSIDQGSLRVDYMDQSNNELLSINVFVGEKHLESEKRAKEVLLNKNITGYHFIMPDSNINFLIFRQDGLTYIIALASHYKDNKVDELIKIANSLR